MQNNLKITNTENTDEIANMIRQDGYLPNKQLWRRWIMTQTLRFHNNKNICSNNQISFDKHFMQNKPYKYAWTTTLDEINTIAKMPENSQDRKIRLMFYNKQVVLDMLDEYINNIKTSSNKINIKVLYDTREKIYKTKSYKRIANILQQFIKKYPMSKSAMPKPTAWQNAFHGAGAYYTMDNLIKFHNCVIYDHTSCNVTPLSRENSLKELNRLTEIYGKEKYQFCKLFDTMTQFITDNGISIDKIDELPNINY